MIDVVWSRLAGVDRDQAFAAAFALGDDEAEALLTALEQAEFFLSRTPFAGPPIFDDARRKWRLGRLPYALVYRVESDRLAIIRMIHLRTNWLNEA